MPTPFTPPAVVPAIPRTPELQNRYLADAEADVTTAAWIYWLSGALLAGFGAWLISWALLSDRVAGNRMLRRCSKCWYDMSLVVGLKCPECGKEARAETGLHRSRRRWKVALLGLLLTSAGAASNLAGLSQSRSWIHWLPTWAQLRLVDQIGPQPVLFSFARSKATGESISGRDWARLENAVIVGLEDPSAQLYEKQILLDTFYGLKRDPINRDRFGAAAVECILAAKDSPHTPALTWAANLRGPMYFAEQTLATLGPQRDSRKLSMVFGCLCLRPADDERVRAIADVTRRMPSRMGFGAIDPIMNAHSEVFFGRIAENLRKVRRTEVAEVLSPMYMLLRSSTEANASRDEIVRTAAELLASDDPSLRSVCRDVTDPMHGDKLMPAIPALVMHLQSSNAEAKAHAKRALLRMQLSEGSNRIVLETLAGRFCELNNSARMDAIEVFKARAPATMPPLRANVFVCLDSIDDVTLLTSALLAFFPDPDSGGLWEPATGAGQGNSELRAVLARMLRKGGASAVAAAGWMRERGTPAMNLDGVLREVAEDKSKPSASRTAARDALLRMRDRASPEVDVLEPLPR